MIDEELSLIGAQTEKPADAPRPTEKQPWQKPTIEAIPFSATEASFAGVGADNGVYS